MAEYFMTPHVHLCVSDNQVILLDLRNDRYLGLGREEAESLANIVRGWPVSRQPHSPGAIDSEQGWVVTDLLSSMIERQLLTTDREIGKEAIPTTLEPARAAFVTDNAFGLQTRHILNFLTACSSAAITLRWRSIEHAVQKVNARKKKRKYHHAEIDAPTLPQALSIFARLRPLLFTSKDACLFDSLALVEFLSTYEIFPTWVIGVQAMPFAAHSWVQHRDVVLNDYPEHVLRYTPILTV